MPVRLGDLLVRSGILTESMREAVLQEQRLVGRPFGELAERMYGIDPGAIEQAWAEQYESLAGVVDPETFAVDPEAAALLTPRQAWQFKVLPLAFRHGELMLCTPRQNLPRALRFAATQLSECCFFVVAAPEAMAPVMQRLYPMPGLDVQTLRLPAPRLNPRAA